MKSSAKASPIPLALSLASVPVAENPESGPMTVAGDSPTRYGDGIPELTPDLTLSPD